MIKNIILVLVMLFSQLHACAQEQNYPPGLQYCSVELNGDSIMFGYNHQAENWKLPTTPAQWLASKGFNQVVDRSAPGLSTFDLVRGYSVPLPGAHPALYPNGSQYPFNSTLHETRVVVIQTGINDYPSNNPYQVYVDYASMITHIRNIGKIPVITGIIHGNPDVMPAETIRRLSVIRQLVRQVAQDYSVHYAAWDTVPIAWTDSIHVNQDSSNGLTENLRYTLSRICSVAF